MGYNYISKRLSALLLAGTIALSTPAVAKAENSIFDANYNGGIISEQPDNYADDQVLVSFYTTSEILINECLENKDAFNQNVELRNEVDEELENAKNSSRKTIKENSYNLVYYLNKPIFSTGVEQELYKNGVDIDDQEDMNQLAQFIATLLDTVPTEKFIELLKSLIISHEGSLDAIEAYKQLLKAGNIDDIMDFLLAFSDKDGIRINHASNGTVDLLNFITILNISSLDRASGLKLYRYGTTKNNDRDLCEMFYIDSDEGIADLGSYRKILAKSSNFNKSIFQMLLVDCVENVKTYSGPNLKSNDPGQKSEGLFVFEEDRVR